MRAGVSRSTTPARVARFADRFAPALALVMDDGCRLEVHPDGWRSDWRPLELSSAGAVLPLDAA